MTEPRQQSVGGEVKFLFTHSAVYGLGTVVSQIVSLVLLPIYTRHLTPKDYGVLETIDVSSGIIGIVVTLGIARALSRFYYESDEARERNLVVSTTYLSCAMIAVLLIPLLFAAGDPLAQLLLGSDRYGSFFRLGFLSLVFGSLNDIGMIYLRLLKRPGFFIALATSRLVLLVALNVLFVVVLGRGVLGVLTSSLIVNCLYGLAMAAAVLLRTGWRWSPGLSLALVRFSLPMIPAQLGSTIVKQSDKYFVLQQMSVANMGIYALSLKIGNVIHGILTVPFNMAWTPRRFELMKREDSRELYSRIFTYYCFLSGYTGLCLSVLTPEALRLLATPQFYGAERIVPLVVLSMIIFGSHYHFDFGILYAKKTRHLSTIGVACAAVQIALNWLLIRRFGFFGAVGSSILSLSLQAFLLYRVSQRFYPIPYEFGRLGRFGALALLWYAVAAWAPTPVFALALALKLALLALFPWALLLTGVVSRGEAMRARALVAGFLAALPGGRLARAGKGAA